MDPITLMTLGLGVGQLGYGFFQNQAGKQRAKRVVREGYQIPDEYYQNLGLAEQMAQGGIPQNDLQFMHQNALRQLSSQLSAGLRSGADANTAGDYYGAYLNSLGDIGVRNAQMQFQNVNALANAREALAGQKLTQFGYNDAKLRDQAQLATMEQQQGMQNIFGGLNTAASGMAQGEQRKLYKQAIDNQTKALGLDLNKGIIDALGSVPNLQPPAPSTSSSSGVYPGEAQAPQAASDMQSAASYLKQNSLTSPGTDDSGYLWRKYGGDGKLFEWTSPYGPGRN